MASKKIDCPNCGSSFVVKDVASREVKCKYCGSSFAYTPDEEEIRYAEAEGERARATAEEYNAKTRYEMLQQGKSILKRSSMMTIPFVIIFLISAIVVITIFGNVIGSVRNETKDRAAREFNFGYKDGYRVGSFVKDDLGDIITSNKSNEEHIITVEFDGVSTADVDEIKEIRDKLEDFTKYDVSFEKDSDGYITKYIIEK